MSTILIHDLQTTDELTNLTNEELEMRGGFFGWFIAGLVVGYVIGRKGGSLDINVTVPTGGGDGGGRMFDGGLVAHH